MTPVVSGVKVGDVLLGTRRLRRWLRAVSLADHVRRGQASPGIRAPRKDDRFTVIVNRNYAFAVWNPRLQALIPFVNPRNQTSEVETVMDGCIFSRWFVHTAEKDLQVSNWPGGVQRIWMEAHLGGAHNYLVHRVGGDVPGLEWPVFSVFSLARVNTPGRMSMLAEHLTTLLQRRGIAPNPHRLYAGRVGPREGEIPLLEAHLGRAIAQRKKQPSAQKGLSRIELILPRSGVNKENNF